MKKGIVYGSVAVVAAAAAGGYFLFRPLPTDETVKNPVDEQYEQLSVQLNDLEAQVRQPGANIDSLTLVLQNVKWSPVADGGEYEVQKRNLYIDNKKNVAMTFRQVLIGQNREVTNPMLDDVESISE